MFMFDLLGWWYGSGWAGVLRATRRRLNGLAEIFSVTTLLHTLFAPWRRIITYPGASLEERFHALGDNIMSRCVGFSVRFIVLLAATISLVSIVIGGILELILWPLLPLASVALIIKGLL